MRRLWLTGHRRLQTTARLKPQGTERLPAQKPSFDVPTQQLVTRPLTVGVLNAHWVPDHMRAVKQPFSWFTQLFREVDPSVRLVDYRAFEGQLPASVTECDHYIISGSPFSVYQVEQAWIPRLHNFVQQVINYDDLLGPKAIGVCYGHQVAAYVTVGPQAVQKSSKGWGVGVKEFRVLDENAQAWMQPFHRSLKLKYNHQDQVVQLPSSATLLGTSDFCQNEMMLVRNPRTGQAKVFSFQGHIEYPRRLLVSSFKDRRAVIDREEPGRVDRALTSLEDGNQSDERVIARWAVNFLRVLEASPAVAAAAGASASASAADAAGPVVPLRTVTNGKH